MRATQRQTASESIMWGNLTARFEVITAERMEAELEHENFRNSSFRTVDKYSREMLENRWRENGETIKYDDTGKLIDGTHRFRAALAAGKPLTALCVYGVTEDNQRNIDTGRVRSRGQAVAHYTGAKDATTVAAIAGLLWKFAKHERLEDCWESGRVASNDEVVAAVEQYRNEIEFAVCLCPSTSGRLFSRSALGFVLVIAARTDTAKAEAFAHGVTSGLNLSLDDPRYALRRRMENLRENKINAGEVDRTLQLTYLVRAWNAFLLGERITKLQVPRSEAAVQFARWAS